MPSRSKTQSLGDETVSEMRTTETREYDRDGDVVEEKREYKRKDKGWSMWGKDKEGKPRTWGYASMWIWFVLAPILIWIILFSIRAGFVSDNVNGVTTLNQQKLLLWTLVFSILAWIIIYASYFCRY